MRAARAVLAGVIASAAAWPALQAQRAPQTPPTFRTEANHVRVEVFATRGGVPVTDLRREEIELLEDGVRQDIDEFERVAIPARGAAAGEIRGAPSGLAAPAVFADNPRARVFVVFLDGNHVDLSGSHRVREPLIAALDRLIGPDDQLAVMTPDMPAQALTFTTGTTTLAGELARHWDRGRRDNRGGTGSDERDCEAGLSLQPEVAEALIARRREQQTVAALEDLSFHLRGVRDGRTAIVLVTEGWKASRPGGAAGCGVDPSFDGEQALRRVIGAANRANASFYPVDPRGLPVFDQSITRPLTPGPGVPLAGFPLARRPDADADLFHARRQTLQGLADGTDGVAALDSNDLVASFQRIVTDLSAYYLVGYASTARPDGAFHAISVRTSRPGVQVRTRRGYVATLATAVPALPAPDAAGTRFAAIIAPLADYARPRPLRVHVATGWSSGDGAVPIVWVQGERFPGASEPPASTAASLQLLSTDGRPLGTTRVVMPPNAVTFSAAIRAAEPLSPGSYVVRVSLAGADAAGSVREATPITIAPHPSARGALWSRASALTGHRRIPTADLRFGRRERVWVDVPAAFVGPVTARLLDRAGNPLPVPVTAAARSDADGCGAIVLAVATRTAPAPSAPASDTRTT
jgi:VWFA-related protein